MVRREYIDSLLSENVIDNKELEDFRRKVSLSDVHSKYRQLQKSSQHRQGKKLHRLSGIPPDEDIRKESAGKIVVSTLPLRFDYTEDSKFMLHNRESIERLLNEWDPVFPHLSHQKITRKRENQEAYLSKVFPVHT